MKVRVQAADVDNFFKKGDSTSMSRSGQLDARVYSNCRSASKGEMEWHIRVRVGTARDGAQIGRASCRERV